jgi:hypothetical protein
MPQLPDIEKYDERLSDALANAWMGCAYWARLVEAVEPPEPVEFESDCPLRGGSITLQDVDGGRHTLDQAALKRGLALMVEHHPRQYNEMVTGGGDASTADVLVQLALFGEVVYG